MVKKIFKRRGVGKRSLFWASLALLLVFSLTLACGCATDTPPATGEEENGAGEATVDEFITLATTTSTYDSGLLDELLPVFEEEYGIEVRVVSKGTGQAIELGKRGDADVLLVHDRKSELQLVEEGYFTDREDVMYNDFIIVGPAEDPAGLQEIESVVEAFAAIAAGENPFVSRGDDSGTHRRELALWESADVKEQGDWYKAVGSGMADTLRVADESLGYTITDRATYLSLKDTLDLEIVLEGDPLLFNQYGIMAVNPEKHEHIKYESAKKLIEFFTSEEGKERISGFKKEGQSLFFPGLGVEVSFNGQFGRLSGSIV
jgi:tungstate transport system substrate-binding protein